MKIIKTREKQSEKRKETECLIHTQMIALLWPASHIILHHYKKQAEDADFEAVYACTVKERTQAPVYFN